MVGREMVEATNFFLIEAKATMIEVELHACGEAFGHC
jgi:hypothetical protein